MTLVILCVAAFGVVAYTVSGVVAVGLRVFRASLERLTPAARARLYLLAAVLPFLAATVTLTAALAPSFGWVADHCVALHSHPHICVDHHRPAWPTVTLVGLALAVTLRFLHALAHRSWALIASRRTRRALDQASIPGDEPGVRVLPSDEPRAFVLGLVRPTLYVTRGLVSGAGAPHLRAVMAHERAHLERRDSLRRLIAGLAASCHLPGVARWLDRHLARSHEMAADAVAARIVGSRARVARALVALARANVPRTAVAFSDGDLEARVIELMGTRARRDWPKVSTLAIVAAIGIVAIGVSADFVHHTVESALGALGS